MNSYSITAKESKQIEKEYEIAETLVFLRKALTIVGDVKISDALSELEKQTRFEPELNNYLKQNE